MADARRLIELGMVPELAAELVRQIDGGGGVTSVNGQTGDIVLTAADVSYDPDGGTLTATDVQGAIDELDGA